MRVWAEVRAMACPRILTIGGRESVDVDFFYILKRQAGFEPRLIVPFSCSICFLYPTIYPKDAVSARAGVRAMARSPILSISAPSGRWGVAF